MKYVVHGDSRDRNYTAYPNASSFRLAVPQKLRFVTSVQILSAELPFSWNTFAASRNNTSVIISVNGTPSTLTIPDGNYDTSSIASTLVGLLNAAFVGRTFTCTVSSTTLKFTITSSVGTDTIAIDASAASSKTSLAWRLGFPEGVVTSGGATGTVSGSYAVSLSPETYVFLVIDELQSSASLQSAAGGIQMSAKAPLGKLQIRGDPFTYNFVGTGSESLGMATIELNPALSQLNFMTVSLRFKDGSLVNLGNADEYSFSLLLSTDLQIRRDEDIGGTRIFR